MTTSLHHPVVAASELPDPPDDVVDGLLWRDAQYNLRRHQWYPSPLKSTTDRRCAQCGQEWPCTPHRQATHADRMSRQPQVPAGMTARHDLLSTGRSW